LPNLIKKEGTQKRARKRNKGARTKIQVIKQPKRAGPLGSKGTTKY